jgi:predicted Zn-dependent protease
MTNPTVRSMHRSRPDRTIASRASELTLLVVPILILFQNTSAAQDNSLYDPNIRPSTTLTTLAPIRSQPLKTYHDGSIRDIGAIGHRDIGCTHEPGRRYSLQAQIEMGRSYAQQVESTSKFITDPTIIEYVNRIGQNLARNSDAQVRPTFKIIDTDEVRAFSLPGGFIFVDSGLILAADNEAELASVISHEMAHVAACHVAQEMASEEPSNVSSMPLIVRFLFRDTIRNTVYVIPTRRLEYEADLLGVEYLYKAGYDPRALPSFLKKVSSMEKRNGNGTNAFETHPRIADRIRSTEHEINTLLPPASGLELDTSEFHEIKKKLAEVGKRQEANKDSGGDVPKPKDASAPSFNIEFEANRIQ